MKALILNACLALAFAVFPAVAGAAPTDNMTGYAWSSNIGWISFNCTNDASCGTSNYGVNKDASGNLVGYAWSSNIGWIQFGGLSGFPTGSGTFSQNAQVVGTDLRGWARALSADGNGWDGWISLRGSNHGVSFVGSSFAGYAWGGPVVGWVLFDVQSTGVCASCGVGTVGDASLDVKSGGVSIVNNGAVPNGTVPTFEWSVTNAPSITCSVTKTAGGTAFATINGITSSGSSVGNALTSAGLHTYSIDCTNPTVSKQVSFTVAAAPAAFSLGPAENARIQFLTSGSAESEEKNVFVFPSGGFSNPVSVTVTGVNPLPPPGTTITYSLGGSPYLANPPGVVINSPYNSGTTIRVRVSKPVSAPYTVTLTGVGSGAPNATKNIIVNPAEVEPQFEEF